MAHLKITLAAADQIRRVLDEGHTLATQVVTDNREALERLSEALASAMTGVRRCDSCQNFSDTASISAHHNIKHPVWYARTLRKLCHC